MKKLTSLALCAILASSMTAMSAFAQEAAAEETKEEEAAVEVDTSNVVQVNVMDGLCTLIDNAATNHQASDYALCFAEAYGTGRTTEDDAVTWEDVTFEKDVKQVAIKCGYNLSNKPDTATEFWLYLDKIEGEPLAKVTVTNKVGEENYTASSQIVDQILRFADVNVKAGTYDVIVVGKTENSGSFSQVNFMYEPMDEAALVPVADALKAADAAKAAEIAAKKAAAAKIAKARVEQNEKYGYFDVNVLEGECTLIDNAATNHQASDYALCFAAAYGTGRTTEDDAVLWEDVVFDTDVKKLAVKCGYNLTDKPDTATEFWVYLDKIEGDPIAKVSVTNKVGEENYTASSQIVDQIYRLADVDIKAGTYDVIVVGKTEFSGSVSQVKFITDAEIVDDATLAAAVKVEADEIAAKKAEEKAKEEAKKAEEKAKEEAKKAEEEAKKAEEEAKANEANNADDNKDDNTNDDNDKNDNEENNNANNNANKTSGDFDDWWIIAIVVVVVVVIAAVVVAGKKKKQ